MKNENGRAHPAVVLFFEPDEKLRKIVSLTLRKTGLKVLEIAHDVTAWDVLQMESPNLIILDLIDSSKDLGKLIEAYRQQHNSAVILTTTDRLESNWRNSYQPDVVIYKPYDVRYLRKKVLLLLDTILEQQPVSKCAL